MADRIEQVQEALNILQSLRVKEEVQRFLKNHRRHYSGDWDKVKDWVIEAVLDGKISARNVILFLDDIESFGQQRVYLYTASQDQIASLFDRQFILETLRGAGKESLLDEPEVVENPVLTELATVRAGAREFRSKWVSLRTWWKTLEPQEIIEDGVTYRIRKYEKVDSRASTVLNVDRESGNVELRIHKLQQGDDYTKEFNRCATFVRMFLDVTQLRPLNLNNAVKTLMQGNETRNRRGAIRAQDGTIIGFISANKDEDFTKSEFYSGGIEKTGGRFNGDSLNCYWTVEGSDGNLGRDVRTVIYANNDIAFPSAVIRREFEYVLRRVRYLAQATP